MADYTDKLLDYVVQEAFLECSNYKKCKSVIGGYDDYEVALKANKEGWIVTRGGNVKCPKCSKKK